MVQFMRRFRTEKDCLEYLMEYRWANGFTCPHCKNPKGWTMKRGLFHCSSCQKQTSVTAGTVLHNTRIPLQSWFLAMWFICTQKKGVSAADLQTELGLGCYKSAWLMMQKLRQAMVRLEREKLQNEAEVDETYLGATEANVRGRELIEKALIVIAVELNGRKIERIRLRHIPDASANSLCGFITDCVEADAVIHTDAWKGYSPLEKAGYKHQITSIKGDERVALECFPNVHLVASLLKRWVLSTYQGRVEHKHLQHYLDEFVFRFNRRKSKHVGKIFHSLVEQLFTHQAKTYDEIVSE